jgi:hypothetical protein
MSTLSASQSPLVVPLGSSGSTTITWDSGSRNVRVKIFERFNQISPWVPRPLVSPPIKGTYTIALKPGGMYEALMFFEDGIADPNDRHNESPVLAALTVFAILPTPSVLITDGGMPDQQDVGGTFYGRKIATGSPTFATMEIGRNAPVVDAIGQFHIPDAQIFNSSVTGKVWDPPKNIHNFMITPLDPGQRHFCVVRVQDTSGMWEERQFKFTTKRRNVKLQWSELHISDDGVSLGSGSGFFRVELYQAGAPLGDLWWNRITVFNTNDKLNMLPQGMITETGLQAIDNANRTVSMGLWGKSYRGWPVKDEIATTAFGAQTVPIPTGKGHETVVNRPDRRFADTHDGSGITSGFAFDVHVLVNISYAP